MRKLLLVMTLFPTAVLANPPHPGGHPPRGEFGTPLMQGFKEEGDRLPPFLRDLSLSDKQQNDIKSLLKAHVASMDETRKNDHAIKRQMRQLNFSGNYSDDKAAALVEQALALHRNQALQQAKLDNRIFKLLTSEQQAALNKNLDSWEAEKPF